MAGRSRKRAPTSARTLARRLARIDAEREAERARHTRRVTSLKRAADRRLAAMVAEIAALRHHEARVGALERLLAAARARVTELEAALAAAGPGAMRETGGDGQDSHSPRG